jgi:hypothetical protein
MSPHIKKYECVPCEFLFLHGPDARIADALNVLVSLVLSILTWPLATEITLQIRKTQKHANLLFRKAINNKWMDIVYFNFLAGPQKCVHQIVMENIIDTGDKCKISLREMV